MSQVLCLCRYCGRTTTEARRMMQGRESQFWQIVPQKCRTQMQTCSPYFLSTTPLPLWHLFMLLLILDSSGVRVCSFSSTSSNGPPHPNNRLSSSLAGSFDACNSVLWACPSFAAGFVCSGAASALDWLESVSHWRLGAIPRAPQDLSGFSRRPPSHFFDF